MTKTWIPACAGMTKTWIPACAGMTKILNKSFP
jgi:hypothetical protein